MKQLLTSITYNRLITQNEHGNYGQYIQQFKSLPGIDLATIYTSSAQYGDVTCEQCDENEPDTDETIPHVLLQYTMYNQLRQQLIPDINNIIPNTNLSIQLLLMSDEIITNTQNRSISSGWVT